MTDSTTGPQLFGVSNSNDKDLPGTYPLVFRLKLESDGTASTNSADLSMRKLDPTQYGSTSAMIGMRQTMELDGSEYYIHCIFYNSQNEAVYYLKISPDGNSAYAHKLSND